jgi:uncharacterized RDD family membrane protein YckC
MAATNPLFAKPSKRIAAALTDLGVATCVGWFLINIATREWYPFKVLAWGLPLVWWVYESGSLWQWKGSSPGRRLLEIQVVSALGSNDLQWWQIILRPGIRVALYFGLVAYFKPPAQRQLDIVLLPFLIEIALMYTAASMTVADIVSRTRVINAAPHEGHGAHERRAYGGSPPDRPA